MRLGEGLAQTGERRSAAFPNVPTFAEAGIADFELSSWTMLLAPRGTPGDIVQVLKQEVARALDDRACEPPQRTGDRAAAVDQRADFLVRENKVGR